jgi:hypothetical protein
MSTGTNTPAAGGATSTGTSRRPGGRNNTRRQARTNTSNTNTFKGTLTEMNGHVFQCYGEVTDEKNQFARTMEELRNYVLGLHFKHRPANIKKMMKLMQYINIVQPMHPPAVLSETTKQLWAATRSGDDVL